MASPPVNATATRVGDAVQVAWTPPDVAPNGGFNVYGSVNSGVWSLIGSSTTTSFTTGMVNSEDTLQYAVASVQH